MSQKININDIYDKNINFLIGSGASYGLFPTLAVDIKGNTGENQTIETLATFFEKESGKVNELALLFMHYYKECIEPAMTFDIESACVDPIKKAVIENYKIFIETLLIILERRKNHEKSCNIFTTNYDGCFIHTADNILQNGKVEFIINDGTRGFKRRYIHSKNFNSSVYQKGIFGNHRSEIPQINLIHLHGSVYWHKDGENIRVDYTEKNTDIIQIGSSTITKLNNFSNLLKNPDKTIVDLESISIREKTRTEFLESYQKLPIVNPTKWKFHETVFEEHYYQMLRLLSYELEKPNSIFITFGFSFADEHILNLVKRSLSNPTLQLFICCYSEAGSLNLKEYFKAYKNVEFITIDGLMDFTAFNRKVFNLNNKVEETEQEKSSVD
ncbi:SIR2 family protein [Aliarcobacter skirrowii]|uniref:SIR2 family protein n=1 Tax=Aliarcobacter skirrowii TaxID=28200 RepID=UPI0029A9FE95|nr:SIR2 family protein [Aliarcobacter skirrowii]MDX3960520.1 SIR2 family protein [Aliarcobacter skirrowii]